MPPGATGRESPLVLIVDDNAKNLKLARDVLGSAGLRTLEAATGAEAIALAHEHVPDVVLLDLGLPDMDGANVVRELRSRDRTARLPLVALTARSNLDADWLAAVGFTGAIEKPITVADFPDQVRRLCRATGE